MKRFKAIAAMSENRVIGIKNRIPWHLPEDFRWFKRCTLGHAVVMGRRTFESLGKPLPGRTNVVLTRHPEQLRELFPAFFPETVPGTDKNSASGDLLAVPQTDSSPDIRLVRSLSHIDLAAYPCDLFICGGAQVYSEALPLCSDLFLTLVKRQETGDTFFPPFEDQFELHAEIFDGEDFKILHYRNCSPPINPSVSQRV